MYLYTMLILNLKTLLYQDLTQKCSALKDLDPVSGFISSPWLRVACNGVKGEEGIRVQFITWL